MRPALALILALLLPVTQTSAQARKDSARHQNNFMSPESQQRSNQPSLNTNKGTHQWGQKQPRTELFCDQYARAAAGMRGRVQGGQTGTQLGYGLGYIGTRDHRYHRDALGTAVIGGAIGSAAGAAQDQKFYDFHFTECMNGGRLVTTPK
ncbi:hypothetical protein [uncultured Shimia sp.]|uniref:hypothetical protein n=1 Tax=uncultured Shimia sp. TaxID=573152 RepID=UPI0026089D7F|nr:hypothetical protein [uncultured Shimia sp.]